MHIITLHSFPSSTIPWNEEGVTSILPHLFVVSRLFKQIALQKRYYPSFQIVTLGPYVARGIALRHLFLESSNALLSPETIRFISSEWGVPRHNIELSHKKWCKTLSLIIDSCHACLVQLSSVDAKHIGKRARTTLVNVQQTYDFLSFSNPTFLFLLCNVLWLNGYKAPQIYSTKCFVSQTREMSDGPLQYMRVQHVR